MMSRSPGKISADDAALVHMFLRSAGGCLVDSSQPRLDVHDDLVVERDFVIFESLVVLQDLSVIDEFQVIWAADGVAI